MASVAALYDVLDALARTEEAPHCAQRLERALAAEDVDVNARGGGSALHYACASHSDGEVAQHCVACVRVLLEHDADVNAPGDCGLLPLALVWTVPAAWRAGSVALLAGCGARLILGAYAWPLPRVDCDEDDAVCVRAMLERLAFAGSRLWPVCLVFAARLSGFRRMLSALPMLPNELLADVCRRMSLLDALALTCTCMHLRAIVYEHVVVLRLLGGGGGGAAWRAAARRCLSTPAVVGAFRALLCAQGHSEALRAAWQAQLQ